MKCNVIKEVKYLDIKLIKLKKTTFSVTKLFVKKNNIFPHTS